MKHVTIKNIVGGYELRCAHCGQSYEILSPMPIYLFSALCNAWTDEHKACEEADGRD